MLKVLAVPSALGSSFNQLDQGPVILLHNNFLARLADNGTNSQIIELMSPNSLPKVKNPSVVNYAANIAMVKSIVQSIVAQSSSRDRILVLAGDSSIVGAAALAVKLREPQMVLVNIGANMGLEIPNEGGDSYLERMNMAMAMGDVINIGSKLKKFKPFEVFSVATQSWTLGEIEYAKGKGVFAYNMDNIISRSWAVIVDEMISKIGHRNTFVHIDFNALNYHHFNGIRHNLSGISFAELRYLLTKLKYTKIKGIMLSGISKGQTKADLEVVENLAFHLIERNNQ